MLKAPAGACKSRSAFRSAGLPRPPRRSQVSRNTGSVSHRQKDPLSMNCLNSSVFSFKTYILMVEVKSMRSLLHCDYCRL